MGQRTISGCDRSNNSHNAWPGRPKTAGGFRDDESQKPTIESRRWHAIAGKSSFVSVGNNPNQPFKGFIEASSQLAKDKTLDALAGKQIGISGKITEYNGKPEIVINSIAQHLRE
jgi:hypothetical protein